MNFPVDTIIPQLKAALRSRPSAILVAEPGAGKTTRVPLALYGEEWLKGKKMVMLEPRRLAARSAAARMAQTLNEDVGATVGYTVRLDRKVSKATRIEVVTEGILTRRLQGDPELSDTALVIFDEFHERSLDGDLGLALCLDVQRSLRPDLKILIMSATLDVAQLKSKIGEAEVLETTGRMFPVTVEYLDKTTRQSLIADTTKAVYKVARDVRGSILVFLPGEGEIRRVAEALQKDAPDAHTDIRPFFGAMAMTEQDQALKPSPEGRRKIVLATTIAETSLTLMASRPSLIRASSAWRGLIRPRAWPGLKRSASAKRRLNSARVVPAVWARGAATGCGPKLKCEASVLMMNRKFAVLIFPSWFWNWPIGVFLRLTACHGLSHRPLEPLPKRRSCCANWAPWISRTPSQLMARPLRGCLCIRGFRIWWCAPTKRVQVLLRPRWRR